ncbi:MAG: hypothetical protein BWY79_00795 [Actinobacteria bacterium ADurb.Bin444]|nr:MAG: hypothetical protein BWY79_00795 [Actinobacteria bacterium ADurb.Bin444]
MPRGIFARFKPMTTGLSSSAMSVAITKAKTAWLIDRATYTAKNAATGRAATCNHRGILITTSLSPWK